MIQLQEPGTHHWWGREAEKVVRAQSRNQGEREPGPAASGGETHVHGV